MMHGGSEPTRLAAAIDDLLLRNGYPADRVNEWWNERIVFGGLRGLTPLQAWEAGKHEAVWTYIEKAYAASEESARATTGDPQQMAVLRKRIADLDAKYAHYS